MHETYDRDYDDYMAERLSLVADMRHAIENDEMEGILGRLSGARGLAKDHVLQTCGITSRYYALHPETGEPTHTNAQLSASAVRAALEDGGYTPDQLDLLACGTTSPDQINPGHASMTHGELGGGPMEAVSVASICSSGIIGLKHAWLSVRAGESKLAAVTGSELCSHFMRACRFSSPDSTTPTVDDLRKNPALSMSREFLRWILSDGAACAVVSPTPREQGLSLRIDWIDGSSRADEYPPCMFQGAEWDPREKKLRGWLASSDLSQAVQRNYFSLTQNVTLLNRSLIKVGMNGVLGEIIERRGLSPSDYDFFMPHMSSFMFREKIERSLEELDFVIPPEKWFTNLKTVGNIGAAAIFSILDEAYHEGMLEKGQRLLCVVPESGRFSFYYMQLTVV